jgi:hypothetical protein
MFGARDFFRTFFTCHSRPNPSLIFASKCESPLAGV